jgi:hypothetical protein
MPAYQNELVVDFGEVGSRNSKHHFRVRLDSRPLAQLIEAVENAHRVYELLLIDRPGDIWAYTSVVIDELPPGVASRARPAREDFAPDADEHRHAWPEGSMPFPDFDQLFDSTWDEAEPEDEAWLNHRDSDVMRAFAQQSLAVVRAAQQNLVSSDPLQRHLVASIRAGRHAFCYLDREIARQRSRGHAPNAPLHTQAFYRQVDHLLRDEELASVAYRASGDYSVLRMLATEQRRRAERTGHHAGNALHLAALVDRTIDNEAWDSEIWFFSEGLSHGDLFIEGGQSGTPIKELVESRRCVPGRFILSAHDEGEIEGFDKESGDGWTLYRRQCPDSRRVALERISERRHSTLGPVLAFAGRGRTLFDYEKTVVVVGCEASESIRATLAVVIAEWQSQGGDPVLVVCGNTKAFSDAGCREVRVPPQDDADGRLQQIWLGDVMRSVRPWFDVVVAINAPAWAAAVLAHHAARQTGPWRPWIVATTDAERMSVGLTLEGNLDDLLSEASQRAKEKRPKLL